MLRPTIALYLGATNDSDGNARRLFVILNSDGGVIEAIDEGSRGVGVLRMHYPNIPLTGRFDVTPSEYRRTLKTFGRYR